MITFSVCLVLLIAGYFLYGRFCEKVFGVDPNRQTPAYRLADGVDYVPLPLWRQFFIQFLNIAGLGPIFGAIMGAKFGTSAYVWIVIGCIFIGSVHDYFSGMISLRYNGDSYPELNGRLMGRWILFFTRTFTPAMLVLVGAVFVAGPAGLLTQLTKSLFGEMSVNPFVFWAGVIFVYYMVATVLPVDKVIAKIYPLFGASLVFMAVALLVVLYTHMPAIPEVYETIANTHPSAETVPIFPMLFITIACGAISGFHATQSPMIARCMMNEREGRPVFFGAMIVEGIVALIWAAAATYAFHTPEGRHFFFSGNAAQIVNHVCSGWLGTLGGILAVIGVIAAPITSGDTAFRAARLMIADALKVPQQTLAKRFLLALPLFAVGLVLMFVDFNAVWRYFAWSNQVLATITLWAVAVWLAIHQKNILIALIPSVFMTMVVSAYFFVAPEMLKLPMSVSLLLAAVFTGICTGGFFLFYVRVKKRLHGHSVYN